MHGAEPDEHSSQKLRSCYEGCGVLQGPAAIDTHQQPVQVSQQAQMDAVVERQIRQNRPAKHGGPATRGSHVWAWDALRPASWHASRTTRT